MPIPTDTRFALVAPIEGVPAGATGKLTRLDSYHVVLAFDGHHPDLVFDVQDTEPEVWAAISPLANPSMTDPPSMAVLMSLATLLITVPVSLVLVSGYGRGAVLTFALGVAWSAMRYGWRGAVPLAFTSILVANCFIETLPWYTPMGWLFLAFLRDLWGYRPTTILVEGPN